MSKFYSPGMPEEPQPEIKKEAIEEPVSSESVSPPETAPAVPENIAEKHGERLEGKYLEVLKKVAPAASAVVTKNDEAATTAKSIGALTDEESKVKKLLELAQEKGVAEAVRVAYALKDYYVLDRMHDELADKLYDGLIEKGLVTRD